MPTFRLALIALVTAISALLLATGCDAARSSLSSPATPTTVAAPTPAPTPAAQAPNATQAPASTAAPAPVPTTAPVTTGQSPANPVTPSGGAPVAAAAPIAQAASQGPGGNPYETVIRVYRDWRPSVVTVISTTVAPDFRAKPEGSGTGSGFMIDDQGHILTNNHVVADASRLEIALANGATLSAEVVGRDARFDLAVVKADIPRDLLRVMVLGDSDQVQVGEQAIAIGNPFGLEGTVTTGIVSSRRPVVNEPGGGDGVLVNAIQTDTSINPGNSGGPLLNGRGEVIGVNTLGLMRGGGQAGVNFAIPINNAKRILPDLLAKGLYAHPFVGIASADITPLIASTLGLPVQEGLLVQSVEPNTGAARAGLRGGSQPREIGARQIADGGDVIVAIDGQKVRRPEELVVYLELNKKAGENVTLTVMRDGQQRDVQVTLGERPRPSGRPSR
jgi:S1-C subfamily serine protease